MSDWVGAIRSRLVGLRLDPTREGEIVEELRQHLDDRYRECLAQGMPDADARSAALAELDEGDLLRNLLAATERPVLDNPPIAGGTPASLMAGLGADLRFALRALRRSPAFTIVAVLSLALGSGANAAVFRLLDAVRLRSLPVQHPEQLVDIEITDKQGLAGAFGGLHPEFSFPIWERIRERQQGLSGVFAWSTTQFNLSETGVVRYAQGLWVSGEFFPTLGLVPAMGRLLEPRDDQRGCVPYAVISDAFWQREFDRGSDVLTRTLSLDGVQTPIIGVTKPGFFGVEVGRRFDVAVPLCAEPLLRAQRKWLERKDAWWLAISGRLEPGWTAAQVTTHLRAISPDIFREHTPASYGPDLAGIFQSYHLGAVEGGNGRSSLRSSYEASLWFLFGLGAMVLLIACANVANLLLARATAREREMGARVALGASRSRLLRQLLTESLLLAALGVGLGAVFSQVLSRSLVATLSTPAAPLFVDLAPDVRFLGVTALVVVVTCLLFGLGPALRSAGVPPAGALRGSGRGVTTGKARFRAQRLLVIGQVALSMMLLVTALLYVTSFRNLVTVDPGFRLEGIGLTELDFARVSGGETRHRVLRRELLEQFRATPGVSSAAATSVIPFQNWWNESVTVDGPNAEPTTVDFSESSDGYFDTMGIPLLGGRDFGPEDQLGGPRTAIVNQAFAKKFFEGGSPLGRTLVVDQGPQVEPLRFTIVGLVGDTKYRRLRGGFEPVVFMAASQAREVSYTNIVTRGVDPLVLEPTLRRIVSEADPAISIETSVLATRVREGIVQEEAMARLSGYFGLLALLLATVGLYGVLAYLVERRTNEVGLRMALGADRSRIVRMIMAEGLGLTVFGLMIGTIASLAAIKVSAMALFGVSEKDPRTFLIAILILGGAAVLAGYLPGRRAARVDPMDALRAE
jgi:predicted permease